MCELKPQQPLFNFQPGQLGRHSEDGLVPRLPRRAALRVRPGRLLLLRPEVLRLPGKFGNPATSGELLRQTT